MKITLYTRKQGCPACRSMKEYLARRFPNVQYTEAFPDEDDTAMMQLIQMRSKSVPVLTVSGEQGLIVKIDGFNPGKIDAALTGL